MLLSGNRSLLATLSASSASGAGGAATAAGTPAPQINQDHIDESDVPPEVCAYLVFASQNCRSCCDIVWMRDVDGAVTD